MHHVETDIDSLTNFKRQTATYLKQLRESGTPVVLTVNGRAEVVVQDATAYRRLVERAARIERDEALAAIREALADVEAGRTKPAKQALKALAKKHGIPVDA
ncbi:MAG: type II toxin-antitoxin system prevent-host-death family antitoxin [Thermoguttaceae bacterium]|jgi:prevent-host-death family protein